MQKFVSRACLLFLFASCNEANETSPQTIPASLETEETNPMLGLWNMDSSVYINDGIRGTVSAPLIPTTWTFQEDGTYRVENSVVMPGTYSQTADSLFVVLMEVPNSYEIVSLTNTHMHLRSTIVETDSISMKTDAYLTRKNP